jgi:hypothetical protein
MKWFRRGTLRLPPPPPLSRKKKKKKKKSMRLKKNSNEIIFSSDERISDGGWEEAGGWRVDRRWIVNKAPATQGERRRVVGWCV